MHNLIWILALAFVGWAGWMDWHTRRIPNWLTVPALAAGLTLNTVAGGWSGTKMALGGAGLALALLLPLVWLRSMGAGDWKLMGALGAFLGATQFLFVLFGTILVMGLMGVVQVTRARQWKRTLGNMKELVFGFFVAGLRVHPVINMDNPRMLTLPFGVGVAVATFGCYFASHLTVGEIFGTGG